MGYIGYFLLCHLLSHTIVCRAQVGADCGVIDPSPRKLSPARLVTETECPLLAFCSSGVLMVSWLEENMQLRKRKY